MKISGIYKIQSIIHPDRCYIGSGKDLHKRWQQHSTKLKTGGHNPKIQSHYNKYGKDDLIFIIIEPCFTEFLVIREQYYIDTLKPFFNIRLIAESNSGTHFKHTDEAKEKIRLAGIGRTASDETRKKMSETMKGRPSPLRGRKMKPHTLEHCRKCGLASIGNKYMLGKHHSEETKSIIREKRKNQIITPETGRKISQSNIGKHSFPHSEESKKKMSIALTGKKRSKEYCERMSVYQKNRIRKPHSEETKRKIGLKSIGRKTMLGKRMSQETKDKLRIAHLGKKFTPEHLANLTKAVRGRKMSDAFKQKIKDSWVIRKQNKIA